MRSEINLADYNPRKITSAARKKLKANIRENGVIGGLIYNLRTKTLVSGHQRLSVLDELNKYPDSDYSVKVESIDVDEKKEKELNIWFNNSSVQGEWDYDLLAEMIPDIDYSAAGLTDEDLQLIGIDFTLQTEEEKSIASDLDELIRPERELREKTREEKREHNKAVKAQVREAAEEKALNMESYAVLNFDSYKAKSAFMLRFGFQPMEKFIKGELFSEMVERID